LASLIEAVVTGEGVGDHGGIAGVDPTVEHHRVVPEERELEGRQVERSSEDDDPQDHQDRGAPLGAVGRVRTRASGTVDPAW